MAEKIVYQCDAAGLFAGEVAAQESPREPGVFLIPAGAIETPPPAEVPPGKWPRWNGSQWVLVNAPKREQGQDDPVGKLQEFLNDNPDVAALLNNDGGANV